MTDIETIINDADRNNNELAALKLRAKKIIEDNNLKESPEFTSNFVRKLYKYPGDITSHRIAREFARLS